MLYHIYTLPSHYVIFHFLWQNLKLMRFFICRLWGSFDIRTSKDSSINLSNLNDTTQNLFHTLYYIAHTSIRNVLYKITITF